jgi:hypothetical protein
MEKSAKGNDLHDGQRPDDVTKEGDRTSPCFLKAAVQKSFTGSVSSALPPRKIFSAVA